MKNLILIVLLFLVGACSSLEKTNNELNSFDITASQRAKIEVLKTKHKAETVGIGIIKNGVLQATLYLGEQSPGIAAGSATMFNTASVNKAVTTETFLRLAEKGKVDLDESIEVFYKHPDLSDDARYSLLTPRIILTHRTGLLNWAYEYEDNKLAFVNEPGAKYGYSGAGFMILANYMQNKLGTPFHQIVKEQIFTPLGMSNASIIQSPWMKDKVVHSLLQAGGFDPDFNLDVGYWNSADDLFVTVEDYAKFLIAVMSNDGVGPELSAERILVQSDLSNNEIWGCDGGEVDPCPDPYGHGLGWFVFGFDGDLNVQHGGNDQSEAAIAYFDPANLDGMIVFINAPSPQGVLFWPKIVDILDDKAQFMVMYHYIIKKFFDAETIN